MSKIIITHAVEDVAKWKSFDDERNEGLSNVATDIRSHIDVDGGTTVAVSMNVTDRDGLCAIIKNAGNSEAMRRHGVVLPLTILKG